MSTYFCITYYISVLVITLGTFDFYFLLSYHGYVLLHTNVETAIVARRELQLSLLFIMWSGLLLLIAADIVRYTAAQITEYID